MRKPVKTLVGSLYLVAGLIVVTGCADVDSTIEGWSLSAMYHSDRFSAETGTEAHGHDIEEGVESTVFRLKLTLDEGQARFSVLDPTGAVRWREEFSGNAQIDEKVSFDATPGSWLVEVDLEEAAGRYRVSMLDS